MLSVEVIDDVHWRAHKKLALLEAKLNSSSEGFKLSREPEESLPRDRQSFYPHLNRQIYAVP